GLLGARGRAVPADPPGGLRAGGERLSPVGRAGGPNGVLLPPIRLKGTVEQVDRATGEVRRVYTTEGEPDDTLLVACGSRRASVCRSCSTWYQWDAFHLVRAGLTGGKGLSESVAEHPKLFVTLTAPSFGAVHVRRVKGSRVLACRPRDAGKRLPHG